MSLLTHIAHYVGKKVKLRGRDYFRAEAVQIASGDSNSVEATVWENKHYRVFLTREGTSLHASCTCSDFQDNINACKHIWATLLAADGKRYLLGSTGQPPLHLAIGEIDDDGPAEGDDWLDEGVDQDFRSQLVRLTTVQKPRPAAPPRLPSWKEELASVSQLANRTPAQPRASWPAGREIAYFIDLAATSARESLVLEVAWRSAKKDGTWSKFKSQRISPEQIGQLPDATDRQALAMLAGAGDDFGHSSYGFPYGPSRFTLAAPLVDMLLPMLCKSGRCRLRRGADDEGVVIHWDNGKPWQFWLQLAPGEGKDYQLTGEFRRGEERCSLGDLTIAKRSGVVIMKDRVARLDASDGFEWIPVIYRRQHVPVPHHEVDKLLGAIFAMARLPRIDLAPELRYTEVSATPKPRLKVTTSKYQNGRAPARLVAHLSFDYDGTVVPAIPPRTGIYGSKERRLLRRDLTAEQAAADRLFALGVRPVPYNQYEQGARELAPRNLPKIVRALLDAGWHVDAEGKIYRQAGKFRIEVESGIDWFDVHGTARFADQEVSLPRLLAALKKGENTVALDDGTFGMVPEEWLKKYGLLGAMGETEGDRLRFGRCQVGVLDALLAAQPEATCDAAFARVRAELHRFDGIAPVDPPPEFTGQLRGYQRDGLAWLQFLQQFGFGGCLADDMGLGKTVMVLALLESRRLLRAQPNGQPGPSLVVVPRSLVFNWMQEAARFTPKLRVLDHTGVDRQRDQEAAGFGAHDVVLTTYGTLRRDVAQWRDIRFDYCILDEAQAIKNAESESAKAVRLVRADQRLALSGTPVQNHLGELWSLFDFLNPGMLGKGSALKVEGGFKNPNPESRSLLARALRPFILRRTKEQVAKDLPTKTEQTIFCDLEGEQRKLYDELKVHYRQSLLARIARDGIQRSKIQVLEALLRLRQAACHPGLIDKAKKDAASAKLDLLLGQLEDVFEGGHKVLIFSQFTSLLAILRDRLDTDKVPYIYLDGRTRDRQARVEQFQNDPETKLFLISLKAGGLGLNLTAAEYVFLLDPWWNPAVEAQAIDRAHRIGQERPVFAFRLIARDTVEEKVLDLQKKKRELADAIINADNSLIRDLSRDDLEMLLS